MPVVPYELMMQSCRNSFMALAYLAVTVRLEPLRTGVAAMPVPELLALHALCEGLFSHPRQMCLGSEMHAT